MTNSAAASAFGQWLQSISPKYQLDLTTVSRAGADAGFRSYHRIAAADGRSFTLDCTVEAGKAYWMGFNNERFRNFQSLSGVPAVPALLQFSTH